MTAIASSDTRAPADGERKPTAILARELILRGARELLANQSTELDRWLDTSDTPDIYALRPIRVHVGHGRQKPLASEVAPET